MKTIWTLLTAIIFFSTAHATDQIKIGAEARVPDNPRSHYSRHVNWRPANGETVTLNPPRISWPYVPGGDLSWYSASHTFTLQIASNANLSNPVVNVTCTFNFYNFLPELKGSDTWYWRVGYNVGTDKETWSPTRAFKIAQNATVWDRSGLTEPLKGAGHPRILFNSNNLSDIQNLVKSHPGSKDALADMKRDADDILDEPWWTNFPKTDRDTEPEREFYRIAGDLALVCFVWKMTGDPKYAGVKEHALTFASYPPGGRASPEGLGGDGNEDATQGNEFLALLFDWLYNDLTEDQRNIMIHALEWRIDHWMNTFSWHARKRKDIADNEIHYSSLGSIVSSHQYEGSMDTAVCALALYEHSPVARQWYDLITNYMIGISSGHGFDEAWNEGPGYGTSKFKWFMNASIYFDTALPNANLGKNPFYQAIGDWFCRVIPVGMNHNAWGNQNNASKWNHRATMRKLAHLTGQGRFIVNWQQYGGKRYARFRPWIEYVLPAYYRIDPKPMPESDGVALFPIDGWAMAISGPPSLLSTYEQGVGMIFQSRPRGGFSHSFNSDNSFQLHAFGQMLNHGGGSSANGDAYAYHTMSHNTILVDGLGQAQPSRGQIQPTYARITGFSRGDNYVYVSGDATNAYPKEPGNYSRWSLPLHKVYEQRALPHLKRFVRHILFVDNRYFVIYDDLSSTKPATYTWLYHILPNNPITFDPDTFRIDYTVGKTQVRLQHLANPKSLSLDNRKGENGLTNPFTGEDYRALRKRDILAGHNLWISNREPASDWQFLTVIYPTKPGETIPEIHRINNNAVRIGNETISFDPNAPEATNAKYVIDTKAFQ